MTSSREPAPPYSTFLESAGGKWVRWRDAACRKNWYRDYGKVIADARFALARDGMTVEEMTEPEGNARPKRTGRVRLKTDDDAY